MKMLKIRLQWDIIAGVEVLGVGFWGLVFGVRQQESDEGMIGASLGRGFDIPI